MTPAGIPVLILILTSFVGSYIASLRIIPDLVSSVVVIASTLLMAFTWVIRVRDREVYFVVPASGWVVALALVVVASAAVAGTSTVTFLLFVYQFLLFYAVLLFVANSRFTPTDIRTVGWAVVVLGLAQTPVAVYRLLNLEWVVQAEVVSEYSGFGREDASGTFGAAMGNMGTLFPLAAIGVALSLHINKQVGRFAFVFSLAWFTAFAFLVGKRAFPMFLPLYLIVVYLMLSPLRARRWRLARVGIYVLSLAMVLLYGAARLHPSLNPERQVWGSFDPAYVADFVLGYETGKSATGLTIGRLSTTRRAVDTSLADGLLVFLIGRGPGTLLKTGLSDRTFERTLQGLGIGYGVTGAVWVFIQLGLLGLLATSGLILSMIARVYSCYRRTDHSYRRALLGAVLAVGVAIMIDFFTYSQGILSAVSIVFAVGVASTYHTVDADSARVCGSDVGMGQSG